MQVLHSQSGIVPVHGSLGGPMGPVGVNVGDRSGVSTARLCEESLDPEHPEDSACYIAVQLARLAALCR